MPAPARCGYRCYRIQQISPCIRKRVHSPSRGPADMVQENGRDANDKAHCKNAAMQPGRCAGRAYYACGARDRCAKRSKQARPGQVLRLCGAGIAAFSASAAGVSAALPARRRRRAFFPETFGPRADSRHRHAGSGDRPRTRRADGDRVGAGLGRRGANGRHRIACGWRRRRLVRPARQHGVRPRS